MANLHEGRWTSRFEAPFVLFLIGMRINKPWKVYRWGPVAAAMPRMIRELEANPQLGFLGADLWFARTILVVQYWRSFEALEAYAHSRDKASTRGEWVGWLGCHRATTVAVDAT